MVVLATVATVIASQAVISGAFSVSRQAVRLGFLPHLRIRQTSRTRGRPDLRAGGQLGPVRRRSLLVVFAFRSSARLATAYGVAVTGTFLITTVPVPACSPVAGLALADVAIVLVAVVFGGLELTFFAANLTKIAHGGWLHAAHRRHRLHHHDDLAARPRSWSPPAAPSWKGPLDGVHRPRSTHQHVVRVPGYRGLPAPQQGHDPAGAARERRAQPRPARARRHRHRPYRERPAHPVAATASPSTTSATPTTASSTSSPNSASRTPPTSPRCYAASPANTRKPTSTRKTPPTSSPGSGHAPRTDPA